CKLNQFDGAAIAGALRSRGFGAAPEHERAGVVVINTCTVTAAADRDARALIRRTRREDPGCRILVTGCYAERGRAEILAAGGIDGVVGHSDRHRIPGLLDEIAREVEPADDARQIACLEAAEGHAPLDFGERTRAYLKVQDGCNLVCSYCIIPA